MGRDGWRWSRDDERAEELTREKIQNPTKKNEISPKEEKKKERK